MFDSSQRLFSGTCSMLYPLQTSNRNASFSRPVRRTTTYVTLQKN